METYLEHLPDLRVQDIQVGPVDRVSRRVLQALLLLSVPRDPEDLGVHEAQRVLEAQEVQDVRVCQEDR